ncbi:MAG: CoB--CoM heterodisulfide reductase iron-sulfur subunit A family protein [Bacteroidetes bacterium]|nr:CoB--CoM heterodisulfide reductase iron-sulfur subunit A family protein [Bacteroidota bacterium]
MSLPTLIIGGGISGITAAVELAEAGQEVVLIEKDNYLGGNVSHFNNYFPKLCPPSCGLEINYRRIRSNPRITYYTGASLKNICGTDGDFRVSIDLKARLINNNCTSCGLCAEVCPEERPAKLGRTLGEKAAFINNGLAFPMKYCIDPEVCKKEACARCLEVCEYNAIQLNASPAEVEIQAGKVIVATGWVLYDAALLENYHYTEEADVLTNQEFERMLAACTREKTKLLRPSDGLAPRRIAFIQCAGSRDINHLPYCSAVCCSASLKHALTLEAEYPDMLAEIFYIDMRLSGRNEKLLKQAEGKERIILTKGKVGRILPSDQEKGLVLEVEDIASGRKRQDAYDLVVLAMGLTPAPLATEMKTNEYGFFTPDQASGLIPAASCKRPMDVSSSVKDATAAALKAMQR